MPSPLHPHYDEAGVSYDGGFFYSDGLPDTPNAVTPGKKRMASLSPNLSKLNASQLIALAELVAPKLAPASPATPPLPNLTAKTAALVTKKTAAVTANDAYEAGKASLVNLKEARDAALDALRAEHKVVVAAVEAEARGDSTLLSASGYPLAADPTVSTLPTTVLNLAVTAGDLDGSVDVTFDPELNSKTYEVQATSTDPLNGPWVTKAQPTASGCTLNGFTSGSRVWVRVRGIGTKGPGAWSDPATKIVP